MSAPLPPLPVLTPPRRSLLPLWIGLGILALILIGLGTAVYLASRGIRTADGWMTLAKTLPAEQEAALEQGIPLEPEDLWRMPPVPDGSNAAFIYRQIDALYHKDPEAKRKEEGAALSAFVKPETRAARRKAAEGVLQRRQKMLRLAEQAANLPFCDFDRQWEQGFNLEFKELLVMRHLARLFAARAIRNLEEGNPEAALRDVAFGAKIGFHAGQDRSELPFLVRIALQAILHRPFVEILQKYGDSPEVLRLAEKTQKSFGPRLELSNAFPGDVVMQQIQMETYRDPSVPTPEGLTNANIPMLNERTRNIQVDAWESRLLAYWRQIDSGIKASHGNLHQGEIAWQKVMEKEKASSELPGYEMNAALVPAYATLPQKALIVEANYQVRSQMIALLQYRTKTGSFPANLAALPKEHRFPDPYTDKPLIYRKAGKGFVLYSVSDNGTDDGGAETRDKNKYYLDVVVRYH